MKKKPFSNKMWTIQEQSVYRRDWENRLKQAYEIILPESIYNIKPKSVKEQKNETTSRPLRKSFQ